MRGERVTERMSGDAFGDAGIFRGVAACHRESAACHGPAFPPASEQIIVRRRDAARRYAVVGAKHTQQAWRQHDITVFAPLALLDADEHAFGIDIADADLYGFGNAQAGSIAEHQRGAVFEASYMAEEELYFVGAENDR